MPEATVGGVAIEHADGAEVYLKWLAALIDSAIFTHVPFTAPEPTGVPVHVAFE